MALNKTERAQITAALDALGNSDTATARGILAGLLAHKPTPTDTALERADRKVQEALLSHTWQYEHNGITTTGTIWSEADGPRGTRWVVNATTGELHRVLGGRGRASDGHRYTALGAVKSDCVCPSCAYRRSRESVEVG